MRTVIRTYKEKNIRYHMQYVHQPMHMGSYADSSFAGTDVRRDEELSHRSLQSDHICVSLIAMVRSRYTYHNLVASVEKVNRVSVIDDRSEWLRRREIYRSNEPRVEARLDEALVLLENSRRPLEHTTVVPSSPIRLPSSRRTGYTRISTD